MAARGLLVLDLAGPFGQVMLFSLYSSLQPAVLDAWLHGLNTILRLKVWFTKAGCDTRAPLL